MAAGWAADGTNPARYRSRNHMNVTRLSVCALLAGASLFAQPKPVRPEFEVASVKPSAAQMPNTAAIGLRVDGAQIRVSFFPMREYLAMAYRVKINQITGPDWINTEKFDVNAKIPDGVKLDQMPEMLQALLEDRFNLKIHREKKEFAVYGLVVTKG